jgi:hypothetical protein
MNSDDNTDLGDEILEQLLVPSAVAYQLISVGLIDRAQILDRRMIKFLHKNYSFTVLCR